VGQTSEKACSIKGDVKKHLSPLTGGAASSATSSLTHH
jgi:hypothetical protein